MFVSCGLGLRIHRRSSPGGNYAPSSVVTVMTGMGSSDQLFGISALLVLEARLERIGVSADTPESVERWPLPARPVPRQTAFALRIMLHILAVACSKLSRIHLDDDFRRTDLLSSSNRSPRPI